MIQIILFCSDPTTTPLQQQCYFSQFLKKKYIKIFTCIILGEIDEMNVCDNLGDHLMGNVYIKFVKEQSTGPCVQALNNRWYVC